MSTRYGPNHTPYPLATGSAISTTASNSLQHLTHLPTPHTSFFLPQTTTQHTSTFQQRHPSTMAPYGQVLQSSLHVANSPSLAGSTGTGTTSYLTGQPTQQQQQQRPTTMNYNIGYSGTVSSTAPSFGAQQQQQPTHIHTATSPDSESSLRSQTVFPTPDSSGFATAPQITQHQQPQPQQQWNFNS